MPEVKEIDVPSPAEMGVAIEGSLHWWPGDSAGAALPEFDPYGSQKFYIEIFNRGKTPFNYSIEPGKDWIRVDSGKGKVETEKRVWVTVDWKKAPAGKGHVPITILGPHNTRVVVQAMINHPSLKNTNGFVESNGYISMEAEHYSKAVNASPIAWQRIPGLGRTRSAMTAMPVTAVPQSPGGSGARLEYRVFLFSKWEVRVKAYLSPTLNFHGEGLRYAISFDQEQPQIINMHPDNANRTWEHWVADNINVQVSGHVLAEPGEHLLKFWMVDPGVILQKLVIETGVERPSYLGPPESFFPGAPRAR